MVVYSYILHGSGPPVKKDHFHLQTMSYQPRYDNKNRWVSPKEYRVSQKKPYTFFLIQFITAITRKRFVRITSNLMCEEFPMGTLRTAFFKLIGQTVFELVKLEIG